MVGIMNLILIGFYFFAFEIHTPIVGTWIYEDDPKLTWEFNASGQLIEKYGGIIKASPKTPSTYQILDSYQSCTSGSADSSDEVFLKIINPKLGSFCYYLETLSDEVLVIIDADSGKMLIFNRQN